jgi:hypothetical protein
MSVYDARLKIEGEDAGRTPVVIDLTDNRLTMSIGNQAVADWGREEMRVQAMPDGFHIRAEGEAIVLDVTDDARFALELGLRNAPPDLRRRMAALLREDSL